MESVTLYRPVGLKEFELIILSDRKQFPPRLNWQPIFYPVLNQTYAEQIAREWNTADEFSGYCGIVTQFELELSFYSRYEVQNVGGEIHNELWVPSDELIMFNKNIIGEIRSIKAFFGEQFTKPDNELVATEILRLKQIYL